MTRKRFIPKKYIWPGIWAGLTIQVVSLVFTYFVGTSALFLNGAGLTIVLFFNAFGEKSE